MPQDNSPTTYSKDISIVIPAYNEEQALPHVLTEILNVVDDTFEIIVVDDGSYDNTRSIGLKFPCRLISHSVNQGKGAAMRTGIQHAQGQKIIFIDADGTYPVELIPQIATELDYYDYVRCNRSKGRDNIPLMNRIGNRIFDQTLTVLHNTKGMDFLTGLYGLRKIHLQRMYLEAKGFGIETEICVKAQKMGLKVKEIPIIYYPRVGLKKLRPFRDGTRILIRMLRLAISFNPIATFIIPGISLWVIAIIMLILLGSVGIQTPQFSLSINTVILSSMMFLAGFQMVAFGYAAELYAIDISMRPSDSNLLKLVEKIPISGVVFFSVILFLIGSTWSVFLVYNWIMGGFGPFGVENSETLTMALAFVVWAIQMLSTLLLISLATRRVNR